MQVRCDIKNISISDKDISREAKITLAFIVRSEQEEGALAEMIDLQGHSVLVSMEAANPVVQQAITVSVSTKPKNRKTEIK